MSHTLQSLAAVVIAGYLVFQPRLLGRDLATGVALAVGAGAAWPGVPAGAPAAAGFAVFGVLYAVLAVVWQVCGGRAGLTACAVAGVAEVAYGLAAGRHLAGGSGLAWGGAFTLLVVAATWFWHYRRKAAL